MSSRAAIAREWTAMPLVLVISSYVAASRVGGGIAPYVLGPMKVDPVHVPTCLFGRHPGWGPPGGAPVEADVMAGMLEGIEANGLFSLVDAVVTGHFSQPEQVKVAADAIAKVRAAPRGKAHAARAGAADRDRRSRDGGCGAGALHQAGDGGRAAGAILCRWRMCWRRTCGSSRG